MSDLSDLLAARRLPIGVEPIADGKAHVRVWAPAATSIRVVTEDGRTFALSAEANGYHSSTCDLEVGALYRFSLDSSDNLYPDPASRFQPEGPHGPSQVIDPTRFTWTDRQWKGVTREGQIVYELHAGTFTREGTWAAASTELAELAELGVTIVELMPIAEFSGRFGWGYDGVDLYAPTHLYGTPDDLRRFVDTAHAVGVGVILDVVYNHLGPSGNYLRPFASAYFTDRYGNEWGEAINFDGNDAGPVREFFIHNAGYWIEEFHLDGLRLDATQQIFDASSEHILAACTAHARKKACGRTILVVAENEPQDTTIVRSRAEGGYGADALWNDDFHHSAMVALTGRAEAYYSDTRGDAQELISAAKYGYLFQGQYYHWQHKPRGTPALDLPPSCFVQYLQNHDQVANSARGLRAHQLTSPAKWRAMTALLLLTPATPMLFQGQEFAASQPFLYFADFDRELAASVREGRLEFLSQFPSVNDYRRAGELDDPSAVETFEKCKLDFVEREAHHLAYQLHKDLIRLRQEHTALGIGRSRRIDGAVLSERAFVLRLFAERPDEDRLLIVNLGVDLRRGSFPEPLMAPPLGRDWQVRWSSEDARYGGGGTPPLWPEDGWTIPGQSAVVLWSDLMTRTFAGTTRRTA